MMHLVLRCLLVVLAQCFAVAGQGQTGGNAMELAQLNSQMMNSNKCSLTPCQSACLVHNPQTGCYVCNPSCNTGSAVGVSGGNGFYMCDSDTTWIQCPVSCSHEFDQMGCFRCLCQKPLQPGTATAETVPSSNSVHQLQTTPRQISQQHTASPSTTPMTPTPQRVDTHPGSNKLVTTGPLTTTTHGSHLASSTVNQVPPVAMVTQQTPSIPATKRPKADDAYNPLDQKFTKPPESTHSPKSTTTLVETKDTSSVDDRGFVLPFKQLQANGSDFAANNLSYILFSVIGMLLVSMVLFLILWRKAVHKLRRNKDELYFVQKAYRQDSNARLQSNDLLDPIYSEPKPIPPPRTPTPLPHTLTASHVPYRTPSVSSQTPVKEHYDEMRHDYLELI